MTKKVVLWLLVVTGAACVPGDEKTPPGSRGAALSVQVPTGVGLPAIPAPMKDNLTWVGGKPKLPKWKTNWERKLERLAAKAHAAGILNADQYDDYRNLNITKFYLTKPPVTASRVVAEYEPSQTYLVTWIPNYGFDAFYTAMVKAVWGKLPVLMAYEAASDKTSISSMLTASGIPAADLSDPSKVIWWQVAVDSVWARDFGPFSVINTAGAAKLSFVDFRYYHQRVHDDEIPTDLAAKWGINVFRPDLDFEGGNFMNTSDGLCAASKGVLYFNTQFAQSAIEDIFTKYLGCKKSIFPEPLNGEGTTHIDMFSKIGSDTKVLVGEYTAAQDSANKAILDADATLFAGTTNGSGVPMAVTRIPMPNKGSSGGYTVWRTYTNSQSLVTATSKTILIPTYSDETSKEATALAAYSTVFSGFTQVKIDSKVIIPDGGAIHCVVMQIATGALSKMETDPGDLCGTTKLECNVVTCGGITYAGCCQGSILKYCDTGKLVTYDCASQPQCGWDSQVGGYDCGTSGGSDPSGTYPKSCTTVAPDSGVKVDVKKVDAAKPVDAKKPDTGTGCGLITTAGCCDGQILKFCENGQLMVGSCASMPLCGWDPQGGWYDCGTAGGADPSGKNPKTCPGTVVIDAGPKPVDQAKPTADKAQPTTDKGPQPTADKGPQPTADKGPQPTADKGPQPTADRGASTPDVYVPTVDQSPAKSDVLVVTKKDGGNPNGGSGGCSCTIADGPAPTALPLLLLALGVLLVGRRLRRP